MIIRWRPILAAGLIELAILATVCPPPLGWRAEIRDTLRHALDGGMYRPNLMDPQTRFIVTEGRQSVDDAGQIIECATSRHPNCRRRR